MPLTQDDIQGGRTVQKPAAAPSQPVPATAAADTGPTLSGRHAALTRPHTEPTPLEPPNPVLLKHGFVGGINQFNQRVQTVVDNYRTAYGTPAPPGLVFDLARSNVPAEKFADMFTVPVHPQAAKARGIVVKAGLAPPAAGDTPDLNVQQVVVGLIGAAARGNYDSYLSQHADVIADMQRNPATAARINGAVSRAKQLDEHHRQTAGKGTAQEGLPADYGNPNNLVAPADRKVYEEAAAAGIVGIGKYTVKGVAQVTDALVHSPAGIYQIGKAAGLDTNQAIEAGFAAVPGLSSSYEREHGDASFSRTRKIAKATVQGTVQDVKHPEENPGYLFLDALGLLSAGAGGAARVGRAASAAGEAEGVLSKTGAAAKALVKKPPLQRVTVTDRGVSEQMPLMQNPLVAAMQKGVLKVRENAAANGRSPLTSILLPDALQKVLDEHLSVPKKIGRLSDARKKVEHTAQMTLARELDHAAGRVVMQNKVLSRLPSKVRIGLSRGEQKAIQVMATDDPTPLETERAFHRSMIEQGVGDEKAHRVQLANLNLAEKALKNPSPRFVKALDLTRKVAAEQQRIKIEDLGLLPETAEGRIAKMGAVFRAGAEGDLATIGRTPAAIQGEINKLRGLLQAKHSDEAAQSRVAPYSEGGVAQKIARLETELAEAKRKLVPAERVNPESFYLKAEPRGKTKRPPSDRAGYYPTKAGPYGVPPPKLPPELTHEFTGKAIVAGDYRIDATNLASEGYGRTVRAATVRAEHARLWKTATKTKQGDFDVPIRDANTIPDRLRTIIANIDEGQVTAEDVKGLPQDMRALIEELYPTESDLQKMTPEEIDGVRWIDGRVLGEGNLPPQVAGGQARIGDLINEPFRFTMLYLRPAYILNKLGNQAMLVFDQGVVTSARNIVKAMAGNDLYGEENMRTIRSLVGAGRTRSYSATAFSKTGRLVGEFWNRVADRDERVASFIYYANRLGYETKDDFTRLLNAKESRGDLVEATRRANKALVEFDNLTPFEKNVLRHWVFVYPWVSRSAVWSIRTILDHPAKTDLLAQLGKQDMQDDPLYGHVVEWLKNTGYIPLGWHDGQPKVVNPASVNTFSTLGDFLALTRAATEGDKYASAEDFLGPFPQYLLHAISGRDEFGNTYGGSQWLDAAQEVLTQLPQVSAYEKSQKKAKPGKTADVGSRASIVSSFNSNLKQSVLSPGWLDGFGSLIAGGLSPRTVNMSAATARYWNDQNPQVRHVRELGLLNRALDMQASVLKQPVPAAVRSAVKDQANITYAAQQFQKAHGRAPTDKERANLTLAYLVKQGVVSKSQAAKLNTNLAGLVDPHDIALFKNALVSKYLHGKELRDWDTDIRTVASFTPAVFNAKVAKLHEQGLAPQRRYNVSQDTLYDYGRQYVQFTHQVKELQQQISDGTKTDADLRAFQDEHDVAVDGLPSFVRVAWTHETPDQQQAHIASAATASWGDLTAFDKQLLGVKSDARVTAGWATLKATIASQRTKLEREGERFPKGYDRILARWVQKEYDAPGLVKDFDFAKEPLYRRLQVLKPVRSSPNSDDWSKLLTVANDYEKYLKSGDYNKTQVLQTWRDYVASPGFQGWLDDNPGFKTEVGRYGKKFLDGLLS